MRNITLTIIAFFFLGTVFAQKIEMEEDVRLLDIKIPKVGQNLRHYSHWYLGYGSIIPYQEEVGAKIKPPYSFSFLMGNRYKLKLNNYFALGLSGGYNYTSFRLKQDGFKQIPNIVQHRKEKFIFHSLYADAYFRVNFGKRGNIVGKFIDLGGYGDYIFSAKHETDDKFPKTSNPGGYTDTRQINTGLNYINRVNYGATVRVGINRYILFANYRMSDIFKDDFKKNISNAELARLTAGIQVGLH